MEQDFVLSLEKIVSKDNLFLNEPMKKHTTFRIGGPAKVLVKPVDTEQIRHVLLLCRSEGVDFVVLGNGSNVLVSDEGIDGVVILLADNFADVYVDGCTVTACAGALLSKIGNLALTHNLTGFEFAAGIPGTLGGACVMNAGAYGGEMKDVLEKVVAMDYEGNIKDYYPEDMNLSYRNSVFAGENLIVLEAVIRLSEGTYDEIAATMKDLAEKRREKQPLNLPSAGSTFKRPEGYFAGKLIMDAGLRGYRVGDAAVSEKHCGFVVNLGEASAKDVDTLMKNVSGVVMEKFGVALEPEVKKLGRFM